ncbi:hypothetical protein [Nocardia ninae]|nr:hypothetical protein [Nocardia ninae]
MDSRDAREHLQTADVAYRAAAMPKLPTWVVVACGVLAGAAVALSGQHSSDGRVRALFVVGAALMVAAGIGLFLWARRRQGLDGIRGPARDDLVTMLVCLVPVFMVAVDPAPYFRWLYVGVGVVEGVLIMAMLGRRQ